MFFIFQSSTLLSVLKTYSWPLALLAGQTAEMSTSEMTVMLKVFETLGSLAIFFN